MSTVHVLRKSPFALASALTLAMGLLAAPAQAEIYKIVNPDGTVTFTDHPPVGGKGKASATAVRGASSGVSSAGLPAELRKPVASHPVTLYSASSCSGCDQVRSLLTSRGVPFSERSVSTKEDFDAIQKISGDRSVPVLKIGAKVMTSMTDDSINKYLTAAGYPAESMLPPSYQQAPAQPLTQKAPAAEAKQEEPAPKEQEQEAQNPGTEAPGGFRF